MSTGLGAVLLDVDGTLYHQQPLRALMACELALALLTRGPSRTLREIRVLRAFRIEREHLRASGRGEELLERSQYLRAAGATGVDVEMVRSIVEEWIHQRPLKYLGWVRRRGCREALSSLATKGVAVGVFSDYPTSAKVHALGLGDVVSLHLCATDGAINAFKPHPAGFLEACRRWSLAPHAVAYVGDRADVDVEGARQAGMRPLVIGRPSADGFVGFPSFKALARALDSAHP